MEFRILGPLEVEGDRGTIPLGAAKQRALLAVLLLSRGRPVSTDRLIEELWNGRPPGTAVKSVQVYVSGLRKALGEARILTRERGYELVVAPGEVDSDRFEALVAAAAGAAPREAAAGLHEALALFRGEPLADLALEAWAQPEIARLEERRLVALEARIDADLALARHRSLVPELDELAAQHPYREHLVEQLVLALYRSGRQADALEAYRRAAARLRNELGLEPSRPLQELEQRILRQDPELDAPPAPEERKRRGWKLVVAGAAVVVAAAVAAVVVSVTGGSGASLSSVPAGIAIVDATNGRLIAHLPTSEVGTPLDARAANGRFWVWRMNPWSLVEIDARSGRMLRSVPSPRSDIGAFLVDGRSIWFSGSRLEHMDIASGRELASYGLSSIRYDDVAGIARGAGSLWVARNMAGELLRVDPATGRVQHRIRHLVGPWAVAYAGGSVWVTTGEGVKRIDAATETVVSTTPAAYPRSPFIAVGGGFAWVANELKGTVSKIDPSGQIVATYETGDGALQVAFADGTLWVANQDVGSVTGIDAVTGAERTFRFGHPVQAVAALHGELLVELNAGRTYEDRIDALKGRVARIVVPIYQLGDVDPAVGPPNPFRDQVERATCAPLLGYLDAPPPRGQRLVPEVAAAMPTLSPDRRTYTFTVRPGFRFAPPSNAPLDAQTFRFSIERALSPRLGTTARGIDELGDLEGARSYHAGRASHVSGIHVRGDRISFTLTRPSPDFLERLALPTFCPVPPTTPVLDGGVTGVGPPGAGPYSVADAFNGEYLILERNPDYGGSRPQRLDAIALREGIDTGNAVARVEHGRWDAVEHVDPLLAPGGVVSRYEGYRTFARPLTLYLALNARRGPFASARLRRAVAAILDRRRLASFWNETLSPLPVARTIERASTAVEPTDSLLPPSVRGGAPPRLGAPRPVRRLPRVTARMAVAAGDDRDRRFAGLVRTRLAPLGVDVRLVTVDDKAAAMRDPVMRIDLAALGTELRYADPASFLEQMLGRNVPASWLPPRVRTAVARLAALGGAARDRAALALAAGDLPVVAYGTPTVGALLGPRLGCRIWNGVDAGLDLAALCLRTA